MSLCPGLQCASVWFPTMRIDTVQVGLDQTTRRRGPSFRAWRPPDEIPLYFALAHALLQPAVRLLGLWVFRPHGPP